jgi:hypothetical protein
MNIKLLLLLICWKAVMPLTIPVKLSLKNNFYWVNIQWKCNYVCNIQRGLIDISSADVIAKLGIILNSA